LAAGIRAGKRGYVSLVLRLGLASAALYWFFRGKDIATLSEVLLGLKIWVLGGAVGLFLLSQIIFVIRWRLLLKVQSVDIKLPVAIRLHFLGLFYNNFLPSSVGGDLLRAWYVTKHTHRRFAAASSVFVDRAVGLAGMILMAAFCYWFLPDLARAEPVRLAGGADAVSGISQYRYWLLWSSAAAVVIAAALILVPQSRALLCSLRGQCTARAEKILTKMGQAWRAHRDQPAVILYALGLTFCCQGIFIAGLWFAGGSLGVQASLKYYFVFFPVSWLIGTLPVSIGGLGFMEKSVESLFTTLAAVPPELAAALALCQRLIMVVGSLPGLIIHLSGAHLPKQFFVDYDKPLT
jgi:hypothetical protein